MYILQEKNAKIEHNMPKKKFLLLIRGKVIIMRKTSLLNVKNRMIILILLSLLINLFNCVPISAYSSGDTIKIGYFEQSGFHDYDDKGNPIGYDVDYLNKIAEKTGWKYKYVNTGTWDNSIQMLKNKQIDLLAPAQFTLDRQKIFDYSVYPIGKEYGALLTLNTNTNLVYEDFENFSNIKIGCVNSTIFKDKFIAYAEKNAFTPNITYYNDTSSLLSALNDGEVDAIVANLMIATGDMKIIGKFAADPFYYMTYKGNDKLLSELDDAIVHINVESPDFPNILSDKYFPIYNIEQFSKSETDYINKAPEITIACPSNYGPISYVDKETGKVEGISKDILDKISEISKLKFKYVALPEVDITQNYLAENKIDFLSCVEYNDINSNNDDTKLTSPYLKSHKVIVGKKDRNLNKHDSLKIAVSSESKTFNKTVQNEYPNFKLKVYSTATDCLNAVNTGDADTTIQNQYVMDQYLSMPQYDELHLIEEEGLEDQFCLSQINSSDTQLISIINKSIDMLGEDRINEIIINNSISKHYKLTILDFLYKYRYSVILLSIICLAIIIIIIDIIKLRRKNISIIKNNENKLKNITNNINGGVVVLLPDKGLKIAYANDGFLNLIHYTREEYKKLNADNYIMHIHPDDVITLNNIINSNFKDGNKISIKLRIKRKNNKYIPALFNGTLSRDENGEIKLYCVIMDISKELKTLKKLELEQSRYQLLLEKSEDMIFDIDLGTQKITMSNLFQKKFGWKLPKNFYTKDIVRVWNIYADDKEIFTNALAKTFNNITDSECTVRIMKSDNTYKWCKICFHMLNQNIDGKYIVGRITDIDEEIKEKEALLNKSKLDPLTSLSNKETFNIEAQKYITENKEENFAVIFIDLDNFKQVNDKLGHLLGDEAIKDAAQKLKNIFSDSDIISRFGGDEFCVLAKDITQNELKDKLNLTVSKMRQVYKDKNLSVSITSSIGAAYIEDTAEDLAQLLEHADKALYSAKENGKNKFVFYYDGLSVKGYSGRS